MTSDSRQYILIQCPACTMVGIETLRILEKCAQMEQFPQCSNCLHSIVSLIIEDLREWEVILNAPDRDQAIFDQLKKHFLVHTLCPFCGKRTNLEGRYSRIIQGDWDRIPCPYCGKETVVDLDTMKECVFRAPFIRWGKELELKANEQDKLEEEIQFIKELREFQWKRICGDQFSGN